MRVKDKLFLDYNGLVEHGPINIVAFGDSVTHGALGPDEIDYETVYWNLLKKKLNEIRNYVPVNVINAGIGGITADKSLDRMQRDVFSHSPDLVIVCFGLNDVNGELKVYLSALEKIFSECQSRNIETVFMTPNMLNTYVAEDTVDELKSYAAVTADLQNSGKMDLYMSSVVKLAEENGIKVCDCYSIWKKLSETQDVTMLLANRINHPVREMHEIFAGCIFDTIML
ncbi:MAG: GDSL family lipase [Clostridia bacterium]|nr:GDSL family lipase [Clostridia bacterium]